MKMHSCSATLRDCCELLGRNSIYFFLHRKRPGWRCFHRVELPAILLVRRLRILHIVENIEDEKKRRVRCHWIKHIFQEVILSVTLFYGGSAAVACEPARTPLSLCLHTYELVMYRRPLFRLKIGRNRRLALKSATMTSLAGLI